MPLLQRQCQVQIQLCQLSSLRHLHCLSPSLAHYLCPLCASLGVTWPLQLSYNPCPLSIWQVLLEDIWSSLTCPRSLICCSLLACTQNLLLRKPDICRNVKQVYDNHFKHLIFPLLWMTDWELQVSSLFLCFAIKNHCSVPERKTSCLTSDRPFRKLPCMNRL